MRAAQHFNPGQTCALVATRPARDPTDPTRDSDRMHPGDYKASQKSPGHAIEKDQRNRLQTGEAWPNWREAVKARAPLSFDMISCMQIPDKSDTSIPIICALVAEFKLSTLRSDYLGVLDL